MTRCKYSLCATARPLNALEQEKRYYAKRTQRQEAAG